MTIRHRRRFPIHRLIQLQRRVSALITSHKPRKNKQWRRSYKVPRLARNAGPRGAALTQLMLNAGLHMGEARALATAGVELRERSDRVTVRLGKSGLFGGITAS